MDPEREYELLIEIKGGEEPDMSYPEEIYMTRKYWANRNKFVDNAWESGWNETKVHAYFRLLQSKL